MIMEHADTPERNAMTINILILMSSIPGLFHDVTSLVSQKDVKVSATRYNLVERALRLQADLGSWKIAYLDVALRDFDSALLQDDYCPSPMLFFTSSIMVNRLVIALCGVRFQGSQRLEKEAQNLARLILGVPGSAAGSSERLNLFMAHKRHIATATVSTKEDWEADESVTDCGGELIERWKFARWCRKLGRHFPASSTSIE